MHTFCKRTVGKVAGVALATATLVLTSCGANNAAEDKEKLKVFTTFTVLEDMAQNVAGDNLEVESLTKPGAEIHEYEPTPSDIAKAEEADLILNNGLGLESWYEKFIQHSDAKSVTVSEGVETINIAEDAAAGEPNPHAWMSPVNAQIYVDNIAQAFAEIDPDHAESYKSNAENYKKQLQEIQDELTKDLKDLPEGHRTLVTCEGAFSYLAADANLTEKYLWAVNSDSQVSANRVAEISDYVKENEVPAVFCESTVSDKTMQQVVSESSAKFGGVLYVDSLSEEGGDVPTYLDLLRYDAQTIAKGLSGE